MANSTVEWWDVDGTSLHQYGWSVTTIGGSRYDLPARRGDNIQLAYTPGARWRPKPADQRTISLAMFLTGMDPATGAATGDEVLRWNDSWDQLRRLFWRVDGRQFDLTRRQLLTLYGTRDLLTTTGRGEFAGGLQPAMTGRPRAEFTVDILLAGTYFYGQQISTELNLGASIAVTNPGHDLAGPNGNMEVIFTGPLSNPRLTNVTPNPDVWVQYNGTIPGGVTVTLDIGAFHAVDSNGVNRDGKIVSSGGRHWFGLLPGSNLLTLENQIIVGTEQLRSASASSATVRFKPPYV